MPFAASFTARKAPSVVVSSVARMEFAKVTGTTMVVSKFTQRFISEVFVGRRHSDYPLEQTIDELHRTLRNGMVFHSAVPRILHAGAG